MYNGVYRLSSPDRLTSSGGPAVRYRTSTNGSAPIHDDHERWVMAREYEFRYKKKAPCIETQGPYCLYKNPHDKNRVYGFFQKSTESNLRIVPSGFEPPASNSIFTKIRQTLFGLNQREQAQYYLVTRDETAGWAIPDYELPDRLAAIVQSSRTITAL